VENLWRVKCQHEERKHGKKVERATTQHTFKHHTWRKLPPGSNSGWTTWRCLNRFRTGVARTKTELKKWGFATPTANTTCQCRADEDTVQHRLMRTLLNEPCSTTDLCHFNEKARRGWESHELRQTSIWVTSEDSTTYIQLTDEMEFPI